MQISSDILWNPIPSGQVYPLNDKWHAHLIDQYKLYVEMADRVSQRRITANTYFLSINSALVGLVGYLGSLKIDSCLWVIPVAGLAVSVLWRAVIQSYKNLNVAKWHVVHEIEKHLPARMYDAEWEALERGGNPDIYRPISLVEVGVPWAFIFLHVTMFLSLLPLSSLISRAASSIL